MGVRGQPTPLYAFDGRISIKLTAQDKRRIQRAAHAVGLTMSEYLRQTALAAARADYKALGLDWAKD